MIHIIKSLKKHIGTVFIIVLLLIGQAVCDLSLPDYTSKIINVGVQQGGIEEIVPKVVTESDLKEILLFVSDNDAKEILGDYQFIDYKDKNNSDYKKYIDKYSTLKKESLYVLSEDEMESDLKKKFDQALLVRSIFTSSEDEYKKIQEEIKKDLPESFREYDLIKIFEMMPINERDSMLKKMDEKFQDMPESIVEQSATASIKGLYQNVGMNTDNLQTNYIIVAGFKMLGIALLSMIITIMVGFLASRIAAYTAKNLRNQIFEKVLNFSKAEYKQFGVASLITRSTNDIQQVQMLLVMSLRIAIYAPIIGIGGVMKALRTNVSMTWIIALGVVVILGIVITLFTLVMPRFKKVQKLIDRMNQVTREIITGIPVIRAFSNQKHEQKRFEKANTDLKRNTLFVDRAMSIMMPTMMFVMNGICILIVWQASHSIDEGLMQVGDMLAFIQYTMQIVMAFLMISMFSIMLPRANVSANRIFEVLNTKIPVENPNNPRNFGKRVKGLVEFKNVSFRYPDSDEDVLMDISFTAQPGTTTAFIGSTGSGKSTLINLIPRFYDVSDGEILIDGINIKDVEIEQLNKKIGYVPQKGVLFSGTIASNIKYGNEDMSDNQMEKAASIAQAVEFINEKEKKYLTEIAQGGTNVSGGQKQRLSIARAVAIDPEIYIFDDSFSALDFKTDSELRRALHKETKDATIFIVAQRVNTIMNADQIVVLDEGRVVGIGTHKKLLKSCEVYREIASSQLTKEELENA